MIYACHLKIVLAEDHRASAAALAELLAVWEHEVVIAPTAVEAWNAVAAAHANDDDVDWLIADVFLPDDTAWDLMRDLKPRFAIHGIAISGSAGPEEIARSLQSGFDWHLGKPVNAQLLAQSLASLRGEQVS